MLKSNWVLLSEKVTSIWPNDGKMPICLRLTVQNYEARVKLWSYASDQDPFLNSISLKGNARKHFLSST